MTVADVVFNLPLERSFHYLVPAALEAAVQPGVRVVVPFGRRERVGMVLQRLDHSPIPQLKPVRRVLDTTPVIDGERWRLAEQLAEAYYCSTGEALAAMVPSDLRLGTARGSRLEARGGDFSASLQPPASSLQRRATVTPTPAQRRAWRVISDALGSPKAKTILLHGVTGSGKTELYLLAIAEILCQGRSAIYLVPEIALTPQTIERVRSRFGGEVVVWHSGLRTRERADAWRRLAEGTSRIVVGTRSAVFAPVRRLGLLILDEEHEPTYKQEDAPRYHAREVAEIRARLAGAIVLLGSATPSVESYARAQRGAIRLVELPERVERRALPRVEVVDLREELGARRSRGPFSRRLQRALEQAVERREQVMLFLNRRGFARVAQCAACGTTMRCERCSVPVVYHAAQKTLRCHYCAFTTPLADVCPHCRKGYLRLRGIGTERVESELHRLFPGAAIARMDTDTMGRRGSHHELYEALKTRQISLLVGTQMIAKGHDFPNVTLVGVVSADSALNLPDFRAGERTFHLLTQVAGRAGRGDRPGLVIIQTFCPSHYAIQAAARHDSAAFYREELRMRRQLALPPFTRLVALMFRSSAAASAERAAGALAEALRRRIGRRAIEVLGPAPERIPRVRRQHRVGLALKGRSAAAMVGVLRETLQPGRRFQGLPVVVDVDPL